MPKDVIFVVIEQIADTGLSKKHSAINNLKGCGAMDAISNQDFTKLYYLPPYGRIEVYAE